jgi:hypothetical protein
MNKWRKQLAIIAALMTVLAGCADDLRSTNAEPSVTETDSTIDMSDLNGTYRKELTSEELEAAGVDSVIAENNSGVWTITLADGRFSDQRTEPGGAPGPPCEASYSISGEIFTFTWDADTACTGDFSATWSMSDGELSFTNVSAAAVVDRTIWSLHPFVKID